MKLRRLQQASFLPCTVENDKRQLQAQSQSRSTSKSDISSGAFLVVLQLTMDIMLSPLRGPRGPQALHLELQEKGPHGVRPPDRRAGRLAC